MDHQAFYLQSFMYPIYNGRTRQFFFFFPPSITECFAEIKPEYNCKVDLSSKVLNPCVPMWLKNVLNKLNLRCELLLLEHLHPLFILVLERKWISATILIISLKTMFK